MERFTAAQRQGIIRDFAVRHNGFYNPRLFVEEVLAEGPDHPAHGWFEWDSDRAAHEHRIWQAREFAKGLRVVFTVEEVGRSEEHTSELQSLMRISYAVFCLQKKKQ